MARLLLILLAAAVAVMLALFVIHVLVSVMFAFFIVLLFAAAFGVFRLGRKTARWSRQ